MAELNSGVIIEGTMRLQDTIPALLDALRCVDAPEYSEYAVAPFGAIPAYAMEDNDAEWWSSEQANEVYSELVELLEDYAPTGYYVGTLEGDGACFGVFPICDD